MKPEIGKIVLNFIVNNLFNLYKKCHICVERIKQLYQKKFS